MTRRKVCVVTGTRAEYGLLYWTMKELQQHPEFELQLLVTGAHLSPEFGLTCRQIEADGFTIDKKVEMLLSSDTSVGIAKSMGLGMIGYADALADLSPDLVLLLGDRYEIFSVAAAALTARIPIAHCHGGEVTEGAMDESIRHAVTKMSHLHFTATDVFRNRVIQLGEKPEQVYNVGALGIENIRRLSLLDRRAFEESIGFKLGERNLLITFHPVTLEKSTAEKQFSELLAAVDSMENTHLIFTKANADTDGRIINQLIDHYVQQHQQRSIAFISLGQLRYLSAIQFMDAIVGNSSSGLVEVPSFKKPTVNIGDRQKGRIFPESVISCEPDRVAIRSTIDFALSDGFRQKLGSVQNPYGTGYAAEKIVNFLRSADLQSLLKKKFHDLMHI